MAYIALFAGISSILLADFVYHQDRRASLNRVFGLLCVVAAVYVFAEFLFQGAPNTARAYFYIKLVGSMWVFAIPLTNHFVFLLTQKGELLKNKWPLRLIYAAAVIGFLAATAAPISVVKTVWGYTYQFESISIDLLLYFVGVLGILPIILCVAYAYNVRGRERRKVVYTAVGLSFHMITGNIDGAAYVFGIAKPGLAGMGLIVMVGMIGYAVWRYKLLGVSPRLAADRIVATMPDSLILLVPPGVVTMANQATEKMLKEKADEIEDKPAREIFVDTEIAERVVSQTLHGGQPIKNQQAAYRTKAGDEVPVLFSSSAVKDAKRNVTGAVLVAGDIAERKQAEDAIKHMAYFDLLTNLPNRALFKDRLEKAVVNAGRNRQQLAVFYLDLDNFKAVNDELGHDFGDIVLQKIGKRLVSSVRAMDTVARVGGDEFNILLIDIEGRHDVLRVAAKIIDGIYGPCVIDGREISVSTSIGISLYPKDGAKAEDMVIAADLALHRAKEKGRRTHCFFTERIGRQAHHILKIENDVHQAVDRHQLVVNFQPVVTVGDGEIVGAEALVRWRHPELGFLLPGQFIHVAEAVGAIGLIDEWVLLNACRQAKAWEENGFPPIKITVNVSSREIESKTLVDKVSHVLAETALSPHRLVLEVTETDIMRQIENIGAISRQLRTKRVGIAIDDFGTGYSSWLLLMRCPVDIIKVSNDFLKDCPADKSACAIVEAIVSMAHSLGLRVIAEGVETEGQLHFLRSIGCDALQGFLMSKAVPTADFARLLEKRRLLGRAA